MSHSPDVALSLPRQIALVTLAMLAFAGNSLLCRLALAETSIDAASFTTIRLASGAFVLWLLFRWRESGLPVGGSWPSALALFVYAAGFSYAYLSLSAATGALLLFGAVQVTMIGYGLVSGERLRSPQLLGVLLAFGGLVVLLLPGLAAPSLAGSVLMLCAGAAWGVYSLRGRHGGNTTGVTAGNFLRCVPLALLLTLLTWKSADFDRIGIGYALASGALASGLGYVIWYAVLPTLRATHAATVQLSVPILAAIGGALLLDEKPGIRLLIASICVLGGIALVVLRRRG